MISVRTLVVTVLFALLSLGRAPVLHAQSLGDLAQAEATRRGTTTPPTTTKVITNADLPATSPAPVFMETTESTTPPEESHPTKGDRETAETSTAAARDARLDAEVARLKGLTTLRELQTTYRRFQQFVTDEASSFNAFNCGTVDQRLKQGDTCYERAAKLKITYPAELRRTKQAIWDLAVQLKLNPADETR